MMPRYSVHRLLNSDFVLWDNTTNSQVELVGPWQVASDAARRCGYYNKAWESLPILKVKVEET